MITTATKRELFPLRYLRKDARNAIYRALYGRAREIQSIRQHGDTSDPATDPTRDLPAHFSFADAEITFKANLDHAQFSIQRRVQLEARLETLRHYKRKSA